MVAICAGSVCTPSRWTWWQRSPCTRHRNQSIPNTTLCLPGEISGACVPSTIPPAGGIDDSLHPHCVNSFRIAFGVSASPSSGL